ncbi:MAG: DUF2799 domain-containing protein [Bdellovibrionales bacterium]
MDWEHEGARFALEGNSLLQARRYFQTECLEENEVSPDELALERGHARGLSRFCTPEYVYQFGQNGGRYAGLCAASDEPQILPKYLQGRSEFLERRVLELENEVHGLRNQVGFLEGELSSAQRQLGTCESN